MLNVLKIHGRFVRIMDSILDIKCEVKQIKMTCSKLDRPPLLFKQCILRITFSFQEQVSERMHNFQETS
jgi:hypothetical protein